MREQILVVEDAPEFQALICSTLGMKYQVTCAGSLQEAREHLNTKIFSLVVLDLELPDGSGLDLCREFQRPLMDSDTPVIILTGKSALSDLVQGFSVGADDYMTKPFQPTELLIRVDAKVFKCRLRAEKKDVVRRGPMRFDVSTFRLFLNSENNKEKQVDVTPVEFKVLLKLAQNSRRVLSRQELMSSIWGEHVHIEDRSIDKHISAIRKKISPFQSALKTVSGVGYELNF